MFKYYEFDFIQMFLRKNFGEQREKGFYKRLKEVIKLDRDNRWLKRKEQNNFKRSDFWKDPTWIKRISWKPSFMINDHGQICFKKNKNGPSHKFNITLFGYSTCAMYGNCMCTLFGKLFGHYVYVVRALQCILFGLGTCTLFGFCTCTVFTIQCSLNKTKRFWGTYW